MERKKAGSTVQSVQAALDILEAIAESSDEVGITELCKQLGMTKGSIHRYLQTLTERGYLRQSLTTARYGLGTRCVILGELASRGISLLSVSDPIIRKLRDNLSLSVHMAAPNSRGVEIIRTLVGSTVMEISVKVGSVFPYGSTSQGRILMAFGKQSILKSLRGQKQERFTNHTVTDYEEIEKRVHQAKRQGWAHASEETVLGISGVSVPIFSAEGDCIAALTLVGSIQFLGSNPQPKQLELLLEAGRDISTGLGYRGTYPTLEGS